MDASVTMPTEKLNSALPLGENALYLYINKQLTKGMTVLIKSMLNMAKTTTEDLSVKPNAHIAVVGMWQLSIKV